MFQVPPSLRQKESRLPQGTSLHEQFHLVRSTSLAAGQQLLFWNCNNSNQRRSRTHDFNFNQSASWAHRVPATSTSSNSTLRSASCQYKNNVVDRSQVFPMDLLQIILSISTLLVESMKKLEVLSERESEREARQASVYDPGMVPNIANQDSCYMCHQICPRHSAACLKVL